MIGIGLSAGSGGVLGVMGVTIGLLGVMNAIPGDSQELAG